MNGLDVLRDALERCGCRPRGSGDSFKAYCPACQRDGGKHEPGLSVTRGTERDVIWNCHGPGACDSDSVLSAAGLSWADLNGDGDARHVPRRHVDAPKATAIPQPELVADVTLWQEALWTKPEALDVLRNQRGLSDQIILEARLGHDGERFTIPVLSATGSVLFVKKYLPGGERKMLVYPRGSPCALFGGERLDGLEDGALVVVSEGEMDALFCRTHGFNAVSGTAGADAWRDPWSTRLARFSCVVIGDADQKGAHMAEDVPSKLRKAGARAGALAWPAGVPPGTDPTDFVVRLGYSIQEFSEMVANVPLSVEVPEDRERHAEIEQDRRRSESLPTGVLVGMASVTSKMPVYLAGSIVRETGLHLWWSKPGNLKTYLAIRLVLEMTQRQAGDLLFGVPGLEIIRPWRRILWLGDEETSEEWKARAEAVARGHGFRPPGDEVQFADASGGPCLLNLDHVPELLDLAGDDVDAVFADPLANLGPDTDSDGRPVKVDLDNPHALRRVCRPLRRLAKQRGLAVFLLHHANSTGERERGPTAYRGSADVVAELKYDSDVLTLIDQKNRDRGKGRFSFRPTWEKTGEDWSVRFDAAEEPAPSALRGLRGTARAMYAAVQAGAGRITHAELMRTTFPGQDAEDVSSRTKRRAWQDLVTAGLACDDGGIVRLVSINGTADTPGHETDTGS